MIWVLELLWHDPLASSRVDKEANRNVFFAQKQTMTLEEEWNFEIYLLPALTFTASAVTGKSRPRIITTSTSWISVGSMEV